MGGGGGGGRAWCIYIHMYIDGWIGRLDWIGLD